MSVENHVTLIGNLGGDPSTKYTQGGTAVTEISLATSSSRKDKDGNRQEFTEWHRVKFFGRLAEVAGEYLRKGSTIAVEGSIRYSEYEKDGVKRYFTDIVADHMKMLGGKREGDAPRQFTPKREVPSKQDAGFTGDFADDDIPFD